jgi:hypothetical protein
MMLQDNGIAPSAVEIVGVDIVESPIAARQAM